MSQHPEQPSGSDSEHSVQPPMQQSPAAAQPTVQAEPQLHVQPIQLPAQYRQASIAQQHVVTAQQQQPQHEPVPVSVTTEAGGTPRNKKWFVISVVTGVIVLAVCAVSFGALVTNQFGVNYEVATQAEQVSVGAVTLTVEPGWGIAQTESDVKLITPDRVLTVSVEPVAAAELDALRETATITELLANGMTLYHDVLDEQFVGAMCLPESETECVSVQAAVEDGELRTYLPTLGALLEASTN